MINLDSVNSKKETESSEVLSPRTMSSYDATVAKDKMDVEDDAEEFLIEEEIHGIRAASGTEKEKEGVSSWSDEVKLAQIERQVRVIYPFRVLCDPLQLRGYQLTSFFLALIFSEDVI